MTNAVNNNSPTADFEFGFGIECDDVAPKYIFVMKGNKSIALNTKDILAHFITSTESPSIPATATQNDPNRNPFTIEYIIAWHWTICSRGIALDFQWKITDKFLWAIRYDSTILMDFFVATWKLSEKEGTLCDRLIYVNFN